MQQETFIVGGREFTTMRMNAFEANKLLLRAQKIIVPVIGSFVGSGKSIGDIDVKEAAQAIAFNLDESIIDNVVIPLFSESKVYCVDLKKFVNGAASINQCFTTDALFDFYELIFEVARYQFGPFFAQVAARFGNQNAETGQAIKLQEN